ncbi:hypothetical protein RJT34_23981 [Clitoria ternatea]|uniref:Uncharacterized protein n=1 Tax=Clitoria ternatea TaxID=43366 RepID=A0AAN9FTA1_CLITE
MKLDTKFVCPGDETLGVSHRGVGLLEFGSLNDKNGRIWSDWWANLEQNFVSLRDEMGQAKEIKCGPVLHFYSTSLSLSYLSLSLFHPPFALHFQNSYLEKYATVYKWKLKPNHGAFFWHAPASP